MIRTDGPDATMDDIAAGARWFQATMGVAHFERLEHVTFGATCRFRGGPADSAAHLALALLLRQRGAL